MSRLVQKKFLKGRKEFELLEQARVRVVHATLKGRSEEVFDLFDMDSQCDKYLERPFKYLVIAVLFLIPGVPFVGESLRTFDPVPLFLSFMFLGPALICLGAFIHQTHDLVVFRNRHNGSAALVLWRNSPNAAQFDAFVKEVAETIRELRVRPSASVDQKLAVYKDALEMLASEEVLSEEEAIQIYERARNRLQGQGAAKLYRIDGGSERT